MVLYDPLTHPTFALYLSPAYRDDFSAAIGM